MKKVINTIWVGLGFLAFGLGLLGVILPILPTTPFLLLAAALFARGSDRFHKWFLQTKIYQKYIDQTFHKRELTRKAKIKVLGMISCLLLVGFVMSPVWYAKVIIGAVFLFHYYFFLFKIRTVSEEQVEQDVEKKIKLDEEME